MKKPLAAMSLLAAVAMPAAMAQVLPYSVVLDSFDYADTAAMQVNWNPQTASTMTLDTTLGNPGSSARFTGANTTAQLWRGNTFSLTPTDANPILLGADIYNPGNATVTTVGLRTGANPLFEMGLYRIFDNSQTGPDTTTAPATAATGIGVRTINIGTDLAGQDWVRMGGYYTGWARYETIITATTVNTRIDVGIDGTWDFDYTERGAAIGTFTDLRIHAPASNAAGTETHVDNVVLQVIPEPTSLALMGLGAFALVSRRRK